ncbi:MAG: prolipoprotein diacylglyceryl transferase [Azospirillaceae bacterium]|nr:prolipoprotein diacylglyceryl transferase [Azospirillaceae bacterium]
MALAFPDISPTIVEIGPFALRWYALAYIVGVALGYRLALGMTRRQGGRPTTTELDDFLVWAVVGVLAGGRIGFILFYNLDYYLAHPLDMVKVWNGGMSFHGGMTGVAAAILLFAWRRGFNPLALGDLAAVAAPIGLFLGRLANFVNGELWGRPTDVPWAIIFPNPAAGGLPRHPSQLYEAGLEGIVLFTVLYCLSRIPAVRDRTGTLTGCFLIGYALCRITAEFFREPDIQVGFLLGGVTMGQILSIPMALIGVALVAIARRRVPVAA